MTRLQQGTNRYSPSMGFHTVASTKFPSRGIGQSMTKEQKLSKGAPALLSPKISENTGQDLNPVPHDFKATP